MTQGETIEINDLALTDDQQAEIKGGPVVLQDCLVSSFQTGGHDAGVTPSQHAGGVNVCFGDGSVR